MATVTKTINGSYATWRIETDFAALTVNSLFTFQKLGGEFRVSDDGGNTWGSWLPMTVNNIRSIDIDIDSNAVAEYRNEDIESFLLINDIDNLLINDTDSTLID